MNYVVVLVFSDWSLSKIKNFFIDFLDAKEDEDLGCIKIERFKDKRTGKLRDSNRTIILIKRYIFQKAIEAGLDFPQTKNIDFRISEYFLSAKNYPTEGYSSDMFLVMPKEISVQETESVLSEKLYTMVKFGMLGPDDFTLKIPLESRFTGEHRGYVYLSFAISVDINTRALIKVLLNDSFVYLPSLQRLYHIPVFWKKQQKLLTY